MAKQVPWTRELLESFIIEAALTEQETKIMRTRVADWSRLQQAEMLKMSVSSVDRRIDLLKCKYDNLQKAHPDRFPKRETSKKKTWKKKTE